VHYWLSIAIAFPLFVIVLSGVLLQVKKDVDWIQPSEQRGTGDQPQVSFEQILAACAGLPELGVRTWTDLDSLDIRPQKRLIKVITSDGWEIQLDPSDASVLQIAFRRSDMIESLHDGSWFGRVIKRWVFLPAGVVLAVMLATGIYLFILPLLRRRRNNKAS
jgi:uncharacterized iron-regulated membrane protein